MEILGNKELPRKFLVSKDGLQVCPKHLYQKEINILIQKLHYYLNY